MGYSEAMPSLYGRSSLRPRKSLRARRRRALKISRSRSNRLPTSHSGGMLVVPLAASIGDGPAIPILLYFDGTSFLRR